MNKVKTIVKKVSEIYAGEEKIIDMLLVALLSGGHVLVEDVPGIGKTTLIKGFASALGLDFKRIQFTPDLLPSDITGITVYNPARGAFEFKPGPLEANIILADEINRSSPKTQSSLLEAMQENQITIDGVSRSLPKPFIVMATQNPIEYEGTFPLPEAQLDRFAVKVRLGYPSREKELQILQRFGRIQPETNDEAVLSREEIQAMLIEADSVRVDDSIAEYIISIGRASREHKDIGLGISPRGVLTLFKCAKALAYIKSRDFVMPDDVKELGEFVLAHRIIVKPEARVHGKSAKQMIKDLLKEVSVPV